MLPQCGQRRRIVTLQLERPAAYPVELEQKAYVPFHLQNRLNLLKRTQGWRRFLLFDSQPRPHQLEMRMEDGVNVGREHLRRLCQQASRISGAIQPEQSLGLHHHAFGMLNQILRLIIKGRTAFKLAQRILITPGLQIDHRQLIT